MVMLDQLILQVVTSSPGLVNTTTGVVVPVVDTATVPDLISQIVNQFGTIMVILSALLASPGAIAFFNLIRKNKERQAAQELTGIYGQKLQSMEQQIKVLAQFMYNITPQAQRDKMDEVGKPILEHLDEKIDAFQKELDRLKSQLPTTTKAALTKV